MPWEACIPRKLASHPWNCSPSLHFVFLFAAPHTLTSFPSFAPSSSPSADGTRPLQPRRQFPSLAQTFLVTSPSLPPFLPSFSLPFFPRPLSSLLLSASFPGTSLPTCPALPPQLHKTSQGIPRSFSSKPLESWHAPCGRTGTVPKPAGASCWMC